MSDKLVFDLSQEIEGTPSVFVRKDWLNILDNQNQNYSNNQSIIDTSQLSNSNKYMSYREAYLLVPLVLTLSQQSLDATSSATANAGVYTTLSTNQTPSNVKNTANASNAIGLKNWFGQMIHSFTLDYNGTTIVQQTPFVNMWNSFKLMTSLSWQDVHTQGATIGFYPDDPIAFGLYCGTGTGSLLNLATGYAGLGSSDYPAGNGTVNTTNFDNVMTKSGSNNFSSMSGNLGFLRRQQLINYDASAPVSALPVYIGGGVTDSTTKAGLSSVLFGDVLSTQACSNLWKSYIYKRVDGTVTVDNAAANTGALTTRGLLQIAVTATIYLKHIHSFFNMAPLLKGVFMKMTLNLNNTSSTIKHSLSIVGSTTGTVANVGGTAIPTVGLVCTDVTNALGGVNPLMIASGLAGSGMSSVGITPTILPTNGTVVAFTQTLAFNVSVGATCLDQSISSVQGANLTAGPLAKSIYLYIPAYTFNPVFEQAYLSSPVKQIKYTDIYQYQILNVSNQSGMINNLVTNGIANIKSVLICPYYNPTSGTAVAANTMSGLVVNSNTGLKVGMPVWQSPFDPAGCCATSPMSHITNFNVQVSGQNAIYNLQKYNFEAFNNQLYGQNAVNGGLTDGLTSALIDRMSFDMSTCYYYVNIERMLPVEMSVPKSIQIVGTNATNRYMDYWVFIEYGVEISIDALTGARV